jgi:hypothetical protein
MNKTTYSFKLKTPDSTLMLGIGFKAGNEYFATKNDALKYREAYPEFFELKPFLQKKNCEFVLIKETTVQTIVEEF